jgi:predicted dehydrogenase
MLRGAFIGFGNVAANGHLPGWHSRDDVEIVAATDPIAARREEFHRTCPDARWYRCSEELLSGEALDFVDICAPPGSHARLVEQALDRGLHVLCEKPLATRLADARAVAQAATRAGRVVHTVHNWLQAPICLKISALIAEGAIGTVRSISWHTLRTRPAIALTGEAGTNWRLDREMAGGGILVDHGWHALYCVARWGGAPRAIIARLETRRFHEWPLEDTADLTLDLASGSAHIHLTWAADERSNRIDIEGDKGTINVAGDRVVFRSGSTEQCWSCPPALSEGSHHPDWFVGIVEEFGNAVVAGGKGNLEEALLCARLIDLAQRSGAAGGARLSLGD